MSEHKLPCCVVRDLLPPHLEGLTEPETAALVEEHLAGCPACRETANRMRAAVPVEKAPRRALRFLKRVRRVRLLAAVLAVVVALWTVVWMYGQEFRYPNTEAGRLAAATDYLASSDQIGADTPLHTGGWQAVGNDLFVFYLADNGENVHGILQLERGLGGRYRTVRADYSPAALSAGIYGRPLDVDGQQMFYLAGYGCRDIYAAEVTFRGDDFSGLERYQATQRYALSGEDFLSLLDQEELIRELWPEEEDVVRLFMGEVRLYDRDGADVTEQYLDNAGPLNWGGGIGTYEFFMLYVGMGIVAVLAGCVVYLLLRKS